MPRDGLGPRNGVFVGPNRVVEPRFALQVHGAGATARAELVDAGVVVADLEAGRHFPFMEGRKVFKHAVTRMPEAVREALTANNLVATDLDLVIPHQANLRISEAVAQHLGLPPEKFHNNIRKVGNTTAASIPLCLLDARTEGKLKPGMLVCLVAFGAGLTWGSVLLRW